ncbi:MAG: tetratricopeptide repeat protein [Acidobacteriaceae bacterium]
MKQYRFPAFVLTGLLAVTCSAVFAQNQLPAGTSAPDDDTATQPSPQAEQQNAAEDALQKQDYATAQTLLTQLVAKSPTDARLLYDLGFAEDALNHTAAAEAAYRKAIAADPKQFESHLQLGLLLAREGNTKEAQSQVETATQLTPMLGNEAAKGQALRALARLDQQSDPAAARDALLAALKYSPETPQDILLAAELAESTGDNSAAEAAYRHLIATSPDNIAAVSALAHLLIQEQKYPDAEALLTKALATHADDPSLNAQLASVYGAQGKPEEAVPVLEKLHAANPQDANISRMLADLYTQAGSPAKANAIYDDLLAHGTPDASLLASRGDNLIRQQRYAEAESILKQATQRQPDLADAWSSLAFAASENHDPSTTLQALSMRAKYRPDTPATLFLSATAYDTLRQYKPAAEYYRKFLAAAVGKFPDQEWQARHRLIALAHMR